MSGNSNSSTDQHYVPQLLLRGFSTAKRKQVYVFDKLAGRVFRSSVRNLACERGFYDLPDDSADPDRLDKWLWALEDATAPIIRSIRARRTLNHLLPAERKWIASFVAVQHVRTRQHREISGDVNKQIADVLREMGADPNKVENFRELTDAEIRDTSIADIPHSAFTLLPHLLDKVWILLAASPDTTFWIGDHPIVLANNINPGDGIRGTLGFAVKGIEVYLPISSELTLGCLCPTIPAMFAAAKARLISPALRESRAGEFLEAFTGRTTLELDAENVKYHNSLQVISAERFVYSLHGEFGMAQEMLASNPELTRGPRMELAGRRRAGGQSAAGKVRTGCGDAVIQCNEPGGSDGK
jgi:hypothetical protein